MRTYTSYCHYAQQVERPDIPQEEIDTLIAHFAELASETEGVPLYNARLFRIEPSPAMTDDGEAIFNAEGRMVMDWGIMWQANADEGP